MCIVTCLNRYLRNKKWYFVLLRDLTDKRDFLSKIFLLFIKKVFNLRLLKKCYPVKVS